MSISNSKKMRFYHFRDCKYIEKSAHYKNKAQVFYCCPSKNSVKPRGNGHNSGKFHCHCAAQNTHGIAANSHATEQSLEKKAGRQCWRVIFSRERLS